METSLHFALGSREFWVQGSLAPQKQTRKQPNQKTWNVQLKIEKKTINREIFEAHYNNKGLIF